MRRNQLVRLTIKVLVFLTFWTGSEMLCVFVAAQLNTKQDNSNSDLPPLNLLVLKTIETMPNGGGYAVGSAALSKLSSAIEVDSKSKILNIKPERATPSFCSGATYLVFLKVVSDLMKQQRLDLPSGAIATLAVAGQADGVGIWGRWNANGPGNAKLFHDLELGQNFVDFERALPGDFMKIWWNDSIGSTEKGHSVIFLGKYRNEDGSNVVRFWSSNQYGGYAEKTVPLNKIARVLFSRLENLAGIAKANKLPPEDKYLTEMLKRPSSEREMFKLCGVRAEVGSSVVTPYKAINAEVATLPVPIESTEASDFLMPPRNSRGDSSVKTPPSSLNLLFGKSSYANFNHYTKSLILRAIQSKLKVANIYDGKADGALGPKTESAIKIWQNNHKIEATGLFDDATLKLLGQDGLSEQAEPKRNSQAPAPTTQTPSE